VVRFIHDGGIDDVITTWAYRTHGTKTKKELESEAKK
jgi:hypothetical protein|tara:strand:+ start:1060 stop:1170 length:111 start_codon:yes stop_codon:yes gene_type:complete